MWRSVNLKFFGSGVRTAANLNVIALNFEILTWFIAKSTTVAVMAVMNTFAMLSLKFQSGILKKSSSFDLWNGTNFNQDGNSLFLAWPLLYFSSESGNWLPSYYVPAIIAVNTADNWTCLPKITVFDSLFILRPFNLPGRPGISLRLQQLFGHIETLLLSWLTLCLSNESIQLFMSRNGIAIWGIMRSMNWDEN